MSHCPQCKKLMRGVCRFCQPQEYIDVVHQAFMDLADELTQRTWVGLTEDEILSISADCASTHQHTDIHFARAIEAKLKEKNT
jgi:hypothetical protein